MWKSTPPKEEVVNETNRRHLWAILPTSCPNPVERSYCMGNKTVPLTLDLVRRLLSDSPDLPLEAMVLEISPSAQCVLVERLLPQLRRIYPELPAETKVREVFATPQSLQEGNLLMILTSAKFPPKKEGEKHPLLIPGMCHEAEAPMVGRTVPLSAETIAKLLSGQEVSLGSIVPDLQGNLGQLTLQYAPSYQP